MRAAGAEIRGAQKSFRLIGAIAFQQPQLRNLGFQPLIAASLPNQALADFNGDVGGLQRALGVEQPVVVLVLLADHPRAVGRIEQLLLDLGLDQRPLLFDHHDSVEPFGERCDTPRFQRPHHADLVQPDAKLVGLHLVDPEFIKRLADVEIAFARGDDAELRCGASAHHEAVELVDAAEGEDRRAFVVV